MGGGTAGGAGGAEGVSCKRPADMPAVTLTYDDALPTQLNVAAPLLKQHNLVATFFVTDVRANPAPWAALLADGHELASHTLIHPCPKVNTWVAPGKANEDYDLARMGTELDQSVELLKTMGQKPPFTFAYPCGVTWVGDSQESYIPLIEERFSAARGVASAPVQAGVNLYEVPATFSMGTGPELIAIAEQAKTQKTWVVYGFHGIGGDSNITPAASHQALLEYLDEQRASFHIATFQELAACFAP
jgi:peptidoglycan/xylan/chitin deacetylase (PgdA/CDA1 family)